MHKGFTCDKCGRDLSAAETSGTRIGRLDGSYVTPRNQLHFIKMVKGADGFDDEHETLLDLCDPCMADQMGALDVQLTAPAPRRRAKKAHPKLSSN